MYHSDFEAWLRHHERIEKLTAEVRRYRLVKLARWGRRLTRADAGSTTTRSVPVPPPAPADRADQTDQTDQTDRADQTDAAKPAATSNGPGPCRPEPNSSPRQPVGCAR